MEKITFGRYFGDREGVIRSKSKFGRRSSKKKLNSAIEVLGDSAPKTTTNLTDPDAPIMRERKETMILFTMHRSRVMKMI